MAAPVIRDYQFRFNAYLARRDRWTRHDRQEVFDLFLRALHDDGYLFSVEMQSIFNLFYSKGSCPFDPVSEARYEPPLYGSGENLRMIP
jgi:hypothetical protein